MDNLVDKLKQISAEYPLEMFDWAIPDSCPIDIPDDKLSAYEENIYLKENFHSVLTNDSDLSSHYWLIQQWGGIGSFKKGERNDLRIRKFISDLSTGKLTRDSFDCISSLSKIASFLDPEKYVIYDSRVIYSLNWLLFNYSNVRSLYPQPIGRSASLAQYDMQTIFRLTKKQYEYISHKNAFHDYCSLVRKLSPLVFGKNANPYKLEMLLFLIAPTWIIENIKETASLEINTIA